MHQPILTLLAILFLASTTLAEPAQVILIRHAEKPEEGNELSVKGRERAAALVPYFQAQFAAGKVNRPAVIIAQSQKKETSSVRSLETVKPLADALKLTVDQPFIRDEYPSLVEELLHKPAYEGRTVLICWEHKVLPDLAKRLGVESPPAKWHGETYDRVWVITFRPHEKPVLKNLPQQLLFGDSAD